MRFIGGAMDREKNLEAVVKMRSGDSLDCIFYF